MFGELPHLCPGDPVRQLATAGISERAAPISPASDNYGRHPIGLAPIGIPAFGCVFCESSQFLLRSDQLRQGLQFSLAAEQHVVVAGKFQRLLGKAQLGDKPGFR